MKKDISISMEFFPPRTEEAEESLDEVVDALIALKPKFLTVTYGAGGSTQGKTLEIAKKIQDRTGIPTATHLTCVGARKEDILNRLDLLWENGIKHIVALRGDPPKGGSYPDLNDSDYYHYASELVEAIKAHNPGFEISVGAYPECHPQAPDIDTDIKHLKNKMGKGADRAITQFFFDEQYFDDFAKKAKAHGIDKPIVAGLIAINNYEGVRKFSKSCGTDVPGWLDDKFEQAANGDAHEQVAIEVMENQIRKLIDMGYTDFHIYSMNVKNPTLQAFRNVLENG